MTAVFEDDYARYYDLLYGGKDYADEARYVLDVARSHIVQPASRRNLQILELGCGTGRHAEHFVAAGCTIVGVDRSPAMTARAAVRLGGSDAARFEVGDATNLDLGRKFDLVVALFHVLSYQTEDAAALGIFRTAASHLRPGGIVMFDFWHGPGVLSDPPATRVRRLSDERLNVLRIAEPTVDSPRNVVEVNYTLLFGEPGAQTWRSIQESHRMRYFFLPELTAFQKGVGLDPVCYHAWMDKEGSPDRASWHGVLVGRRGNP